MINHSSFHEFKFQHTNQVCYNNNNTTCCIAIAIEIAFFKFITFDSSNWLHLNCKIGIKSRKYKYTQCIHSIMFVQK